MQLYISSYEYSDLSTPNRIVKYFRTNIENRKVLIVDIENPINGQKYGLLDQPISQLFLVNRFNEHSFEKLNKFPIDVHVFISLRKDVKNIQFSNLEHVAWATLYNNIKDAKSHKEV
jgi:hypothetical protein